MEKLAIMRDDKLEQMAKTIFGAGLVDKAYVASYWFYNSTGHENKCRLAGEIYEEVADEICIDGKNIIILFTNGKAVLFTNAEWGSIERVNLKECVDYTEEV
jgi:hypothetical protein